MKFKIKSKLQKPKKVPKLMKIDVEINDLFSMNSVENQGDGATEKDSVIKIQDLQKIKTPILRKQRRPQENPVKVWSQEMT